MTKLALVECWGGMLRKLPYRTFIHRIDIQRWRMIPLHHVKFGEFG